MNAVDRERLYAEQVGPDAGATLHFSHFATCPSADEHRRPR